MKDNNMRTLQIQIPDFVNIDLREIRLMIGAKLYEKGDLSLGQAAELAGLSKRTFMELIGDYGVSIFNYHPEDIEADFNNA
jgi:predicted HTH domain antitoxin